METCALILEEKTTDLMFPAFEELSAQSKLLMNAVDACPNEAILPTGFNSSPQPNCRGRIELHCNSAQVRRTEKAERLYKIG